MTERRLTTPLSEEAVRGLALGDIVYLDGRFYTGRDEMHLRTLEFLEEGKPLPEELAGAALFHCGPIMRKTDEGWELVAAGPTTSSRMNSLEPAFLEKTGVRAIIGKGGMSRPTVEAMQRLGAVYLSLTGGAAVLAARGVGKVHGVHWFDLGMPEAFWVLEGKNFGPLIVSMDAHGNSLYEKVNSDSDANNAEIRKRLGLD